ncbi:hypothetical protein Acor_70770 [Acrocarpospora corrugata]|uniref:Uncharacterized protein n=1 Tax=Acrocarpospora corrugata TaxID=35763 RepID=A0A5M3W9H8_9ACTN|nr:hypothetical protein Acor_70770 [Acrocarpospora corrugata]
MYPLSTQYLGVGDLTACRGGGVGGRGDYGRGCTTPVKPSAAMLSETEIKRVSFIGPFRWRISTPGRFKWGTENALKIR